LNTATRAARHARILLLLLAGMIGHAASAPAWAAPRVAQGDAARKQAVAVRVPEAAIDLDGRLDEATWQSAPPLADFVQKEPKEGDAPSDGMEVRFAYDSRALYVGARMRSPGRSDIQAPLGRRDEGVKAEHLYVSLDTYLDRRTAYTFGVTAAGVRLDHYHATDNEGDRDSGFDPVWEARTAIEDDGWTAEMRIPFSQLRYQQAERLVFGLNLDRWIPSRNEDVYWVLVRKSETGWASRFGELSGIEGIRPTRRLEVTPYAAGSSRVPEHPDPADPFATRTPDARVGGDLKVGVGPNLTLDATFNPDFGQVEADPAEVNLSAFETFFPEKRPFFREGMELLRGQGGSYFYSRRIGAPPRAEVLGDYVDYPRSVPILAAAKLTGRLSSGTSLGALAAVTGRSSARSFTAADDAIRSEPVAPVASYGVARVQRDFGRNQSTAGLMLTGVHRDMDADDPLAAVYNRNAFSGGADWRLRFQEGGAYELVGFAGFSHVAGEEEAIAAVQQTSARYFQRPDISYVRLDPTRRSLSGYTWALGLTKRAGRHWLWSAQGSAQSPGYEVNDLGRVSTADGRSAQARLSYRETKPGRVFRSYQVNLSGVSEWSFGGDRQERFAVLNANATLRNYLRVFAFGGLSARAQDERATRGGPSMGTGQGYDVSGGLRNNMAAKTGWEVALGVSGDELGSRARFADLELSLRPSPRLQVSLEGSYSNVTSSRQYVSTVEGGRPETYGSRYVFAFIDRATWSLQARLGFTFKPDLTLDLYMEPFAASGRYYDHGELRAPRSRELVTYGTEGTGVALQPDGTRVVTAGGPPFTLDNLDFNVLSFRSNLVLRWEWRRGSSLYVVWQQDRYGSEAIGDRIRARDMFRSITAPGDHVFAVKASFWVPIG
jgi:hypothetical protein